MAQVQAQVQVDDAPHMLLIHVRSMSLCTESRVGGVHVGQAESFTSDFAGNPQGHGVPGSARAALQTLG